MDATFSSDQSIYVNLPLVNNVLVKVCFSFSFIYSSRLIKVLGLDAWWLVVKQAAIFPIIQLRLQYRRHLRLIFDML
jgi:hypothetical protein